MSEAARVSTSTTPSTTMPIEMGPFRRFTWTTIMQVRSVCSCSGRPNLRRRSTTGMTLPRRLITPFTWAGVCGKEVMSCTPMISRTCRTRMPNSSRPSSKTRYFPPRSSPVSGTAGALSDTVDTMHFLLGRLGHDAPMVARRNAGGRSIRNSSPVVLIVISTKYRGAIGPMCRILNVDCRERGKGWEADPRAGAGAKKRGRAVSAVTVLPLFFSRLVVADEVDQDLSIGFHRLPVEQSGAVAPLFHGFHGCVGEHGVAGDYLHFLDVPVRADGGIQRDGSLGAGLFGDLGILGVLTIDQHGRLDLAAGPQCSPKNPDHHRPLRRVL